MEKQRFNFRAGKINKSRPTCKIYTQMGIEVISVVNGALFSLQPYPQ